VVLRLYRIYSEEAKWQRKPNTSALNYKGHNCPCAATGHTSVIDILSSSHIIFLELVVLYLVRLIAISILALKDMVHQLQFP
jgi:hypothetical protein